MEELLNKLIEKGWKPYGIEKDDIEVCSYEKDRKRISIGYMNWASPSKGDYDWLFMSLRDVTVKESGLWQFVCENGMVNKVDNDRRYFDELNDICYDKTFHDDECQYWIIESALCDEDKLEQFLLDNIKVE